MGAWSQTLEPLPSAGFGALGLASRRARIEKLGGVVPSSTSPGTDRLGVAVSRMRVQILQGGLIAELHVTVGPPVSETELTEVLQLAGVREGLDVAQHRAVVRGLQRRDYCVESLVIARGRAGQPARDGQLELSFGAAQPSSASRLPGSVGLCEPASLEVASLGQRIARYRPAATGVDGVTVTGKCLAQSDGVECLPSLGMGVNYDRESGWISAARSGVISWVEGQMLDVTDVYETPGDVDEETGNVHMIGAVRVVGDVQEGFSVSASSNVCVEGHVAGGVVDSRANVLVGGGLLGRGAGVIRARGSVTCRHLNGGRIISQSAIHVEDQSVNGHLAAPEVRVTSGRGKVVGGVVRAEHSIEVVEAGCSSEVETILAAADLKEHKAKVRRLQKQSDGASRQRSKALRADGSAARKASRSQASTTGRLQALLRRQIARQAELMETARILVLGGVHPNVRIRFGAHELEIVETMGSTRFRFDRVANRICAEDYKT